MAKKITIILAVLLPFLMMGLIALAIYIPQLSTKPQYNFLYSQDQSFSSVYTIQVENQALKLDKRECAQESSFSSFSSQGQIKNDVYCSKYDQSEPVLYLHDVKTNQSRQITIEEASKLKLSADQKSPDGFEFTSSYPRSGFFNFYSTRRETYYLKGNGAVHKQQLVSHPSYYNYRLIGWLIP